MRFWWLVSCEYCNHEQARLLEVVVVAVAVVAAVASSGFEKLVVEIAVVVECGS